MRPPAHLQTGRGERREKGLQLLSPPMAPVPGRRLLLCGMTLGSSRHVLRSPLPRHPCPRPCPRQHCPPWGPLPLRVLSAPQTPAGLQCLLKTHAGPAPGWLWNVTEPVQPRSPLQPPLEGYSPICLMPPLALEGQGSPPSWAPQLRVGPQRTVPSCPPLQATLGLQPFIPRSPKEGGGQGAQHSPPRVVAHPVWGAREATGRGKRGLAPRRQVDGWRARREGSRLVSGARAPSLLAWPCKPGQRPPSWSVSTCNPRWDRMGRKATRRPQILRGLQSDGAAAEGPTGPRGRLQGKRRARPSCARRPRLPERGHRDTGPRPTAVPSVQDPEGSCFQARGHASAASRLTPSSWGHMICPFAGTRIRGQGRTPPGHRARPPSRRAPRGHSWALTEPQATVPVSPRS